MSSTDTRASQVGLFTAQISEQIVRLKALSQGDARSPSHDVVAIKRAVMATRLLSGSARVLQAQSLQEFLDELLAWLHFVEEQATALTASQGLILESVIELEEQLMLHIDDCGDDPDIAPFEEDFAQLRGLLHRNLEHASRTAEFSGSGEEPEPAESERSASHVLIDAVRALVAHLDAGLTVAGAENFSREQLEQLEKLAAQLNQSIQARLVEPSVEVEASKPGEGWPSGDALFDAVWESVSEHSRNLGQPIELVANGSGGVLHESQRSLVQEILQLLLRDICSTFGYALADGQMPTTPRIEVGLRQEDGRVRISIGDNTPGARLQTVLAESDPLTLYEGLRQVRALFQRTQGLLLVEPQETPDERFVVVLPAGPEATGHLLIDVDGSPVAIPWVLVEGTVPYRGLEILRDQSGESFSRHGRNIPLVDLSRFVPALMPLEDPSHVLVVGSVEKRVGIVCSHVGARLEAERRGPAPSHWDSVARASVPWNGTTVPVLDVDELLRRRFDSTRDAYGEPGSILERPAKEPPTLDTTSSPRVTAQVETSPAPAAGGDGVSILLVNQSEFRRRELARALSDLGHAVHDFPDVESALSDSAPGEYRVVITDLRLGQSSQNSLHDLRASAESLPVILTSAVARDQAQILAERVGADACWLDPYRPSDFQELLRRLV